MQKKQKTRPVVVPKINLVPRDPFYDSLIGKFMVWAIRVGRYIIVFTEIIVIMSFASRFKLDRDNTDLTARITQKKAIVQSYGDIEPRTRALQENISTADKLIKTIGAVEMFELIVTKIPQEVELTQFSYDPTEMRVTGRALTSTAFAQMLTTIQKEPKFKSVSVDKITSGDAKEPGIVFIVRVLLTDGITPIADAPAGSATEPEL